jgi:hypothetical protein
MRIDRGRNSARYVRDSGRAHPRPAIMRLVFRLPPSLELIAPGRHQPAPNGCVLEIEHDGRVSVSGPTRMEIFDHVRAFLRVVARNKPACTITAVLRSPPGHWPGSSGADGWTIAVNAGIVFAPTGVGVEIGPELLRSSDAA